MENEAGRPNLIKSPYVQSCLALGIGATFHPLLYAKTLMQLGHEPLPLEPAKTWIFFGKEGYCLPNTFKYLKHIKKTDGFFGLYRGVGANICNNICGLGVSIAFQRYLDEFYPDPELSENQLKIETDGEAYCRFFRKLLKETVAKTAGTIASRPLQVIMVRRMAQFIGGETIYLTVFGTFATIYREEGVAGLFSGLVPQLVGEFLLLWTANSLLFLVDRISRYYEVENQEVQESENEPHPQSFSLTMKQTARFIIPYIVSTLCYPFSLVSTVMAVNGSPLSVGQKPMVPIFYHWQDCYDFLAADKQLKRGSKMFFRWYDGPVTIKRGSPYALTSGHSE